MRRRGLLVRRDLHALRDTVLQVRIHHHRERLVRFYSEYNPEKVGQVEHILSQWRGQEAEMFICLEQKYGLDV